MSAQDIIVIGGSAGGLEAMAKVVSRLPGDLEASVFVVLHTSPQSSGALPQILGRNAELRVAFGLHGEIPRHGHVYVAPPDYHLTLVDDVLSVTRGPRENGFRPAIDPLFRSAAKQYRDRVVGVILSGALDDGTFGLIAIKEMGGAAIVQHPYEAYVPSMPLSAIQNVEVDHIVHTDDIPALLVRGTRDGLRTRPPARPAGEQKAEPDPTHRDINLAATPPDTLPEPPSTFVCPECGGSLFEVDEAGMKRFRCFTGHGFTVDTLLAAQNGNLEEALWSAVRVLMERAALHREMAQRTGHRGMKSAADRYQQRAQEEEKNAQAIRQMLAAHSAATAEPVSSAVDETI